MTSGTLHDGLGPNSSGQLAELIVYIIPVDQRHQVPLGRCVGWWWWSQGLKMALVACNHVRLLTADHTTPSHWLYYGSMWFESISDSVKGCQRNNIFTRDIPPNACVKNSSFIPLAMWNYVAWNNIWFYCNINVVTASLGIMHTSTTWNTKIARLSQSEFTLTSTWFRKCKRNCTLIKEWGVITCLFSDFIRILT